MKLKYYLRGLGIGIAVTALILGLAPGKAGDASMTDAQIIARAKELGMVERRVLSDTVEPESGEAGDTPGGMDDASGSPDQKDTSDTDESGMEEKENAVSDRDDRKEESGGLDESTEPEEPSVADGDVPEADSEDPGADSGVTEADSDDLETGGDNPGIDGLDSATETVRVEIVRGDSSDTVSRKLKEAGLVVDDVAYNRFLCENGYDKSILANTYEIPIGISEGEIAALITGR